MSRRVRAYIGLGANLGDSQATLTEAVAALGAMPGARLRKVSLLYRTAPVGVTEQPDRASEFVQSLERGLAVIRAFDAEHPELTLSEVARITGFTRATARRFLHTLVELGYMLNKQLDDSGIERGAGHLLQQR